MIFLNIITENIIREMYSEHQTIIMIDGQTS